MYAMNKRITIKNMIDMWYQKKDIANQIWCHRNTVTNIEKENPIKERVEQNNKIHPLDKHKEFIQNKLDQKLSLIRIHQDLMMNTDYNRWYDALAKYVKSRKLKSNNKVYVVINTEPWEEAQVDFWFAWLTPYDAWNGAIKLKKTWVFVMTLWFSRYWFYKSVYDQKVETFIQCHIEAFEYFWWVPEVVKIDNLKAAVIKHSFYEPEYQKDYLAFSKYYCFKILACKVRYPEEKGKVESWVKYVKWNFYKWRTAKNLENLWEFKNWDDLDNRLSDWQDNVANKRIHWTTKKIPEIIFNAEEKHKLINLPGIAWEVYESERRRVWTTCHIVIKWNYYSVPYKHIWNYVDVKIWKNLIKIYENKTYELVATHNRLAWGVEWEYITNNSHYPDYKRHDLKNCFNTEFQYSQSSKMKNIWESAHEYFIQMMKHDRDWSKKVKWILHLEKKYWKEVINLSCKRALEFEVYWYKVIENICNKWLYKNNNFETNINKPSWSFSWKLVRSLSYYSQILLTNS